MKNIRRIVTVLLVTALLVCCVPAVFAAQTLTYQEYLALSTEEQIEYRNTFSSNAAFRQWYLDAKQAYEDSQNKVTIGNGNSVDITDYLNPPIGSGNCGEALTWKLSKEYVLTITGSGAMYDYTAETLPWAAHADSIKKIVLPEEMTSIGNYAFYNCSKITNLKLSGAIINIGENAFANCSGLASVIYAGRNTASATSSAAAWNKITIGNGNTALTNADITYTGEVRVSGATLSLEHNISVMYKVKKALVETYGFSDPYLQVEFNGNTYTLTEYEYTEGSDEYIFRFRNIAPNQMNDTLTSTLFATRDGITYASTSVDYSVATYCNNQLPKFTSDSYAEIRTLLVDLLNYGAAAQQLTNYNTDNLVNANLTETQKSWATEDAPALVDNTNTKYATIDNPTVKFKGAGLVLQDSVTVRYKIEAADITGLTVKIACDGKTWTIPASQFVHDSGNIYYVYFNGLNAGQMRSLMHVTVYNGDTAVSNTAQYSIVSYAEKNKDDATLSEIVTAMMKYGDAAFNYAN